MFYKKQNSAIVAICLGIILAGFGFLGGYFTSGYSLSRTYSAKVSSYDKQIADLQAKNKSASSQIKKLQTSLAQQTTEDADNASSDRDSEQANSSKSSKDNDDSSSAYSSADKTSDDNSAVDGSAITSKNQASTSSKTAQDKSKTRYILKLYNNKPTVFDYTNNKIGDIQSIINIDINSLSTSDRALLEKGIVINGDEELAKVLEDYSS